jgi:hypothetical protein
MGIAVPAILIGILAAVPALSQTNPQPAPIVVDYPGSGAIFPPEITPSTFLWRDSAEGVSLWHQSGAR